MTDRQNREDIRELRDIVKYDNQLMKPEFLPRGVAELSRLVLILLDRVAELEGRLDRRGSYEAEQNERR